MKQGWYLNIFRHYGKKHGEDDLTRALLVSTRLIKESTLLMFFKELRARLDSREKRLLSKSVLKFDVLNDRFGFDWQDEIDRDLLGDFKSKIVLIISTQKNVIDFTTAKKLTKTRGELPGSRPDGWIYSAEHRSFCMLIESKIGSNPVDAEQIFLHGHHFFKLNASKLKTRIIHTTWDTVAAAFDALITNNRTTLQPFEQKVIESFLDYMLDHDYQKFAGISRPDANFEDLLRDYKNLTYV